MKSRLEFTGKLRTANCAVASRAGRGRPLTSTLDDPVARYAAEMRRIVHEANNRGNVNRDRLARDLGRGKSSVYAYLSGKTLPDNTVLLTLLRLMKVPEQDVRGLFVLWNSAKLAPPAAVRSARIVPRQMPTCPRPFVGRAKELTELGQFQPQKDDPPADPVVVTVDGSPGVGKSSLAAYWAHSLADRFPDGQLWVDLRGFDSRGPLCCDEALHGFLTALGVAAQAMPVAQSTKESEFRNLMLGRRMLIVLDNARSSADVRALLPGTPGTLVVVTSRTRLDGLVIRDGAYRIGLDVLQLPDAVELLRLRSGLVDEDELTALAQWCSRLPLALSLAAARVHRDSGSPLADLREQRSRLDFLRTADPESDARTVFASSYIALPAAAARLFRLCGVHPGQDVDRHVCAALLGRSAPPEAELTILDTANLMTATADGRFRRHDLLRDYAVELAETEETPQERRAAVARMLDHYLATALWANALIQPVRAHEYPEPENATVRPGIRDYTSAMRWLETELATVLSLVELAANTGFDSHAWRLAWAYTTFLRRTGRRADRAAVHEKALVVVSRSGDRAARATTFRLRADALARLGRTDEAEELLRRSVEECTELGDVDGVRQANLSLCRVYEGRGLPREALQFARLALSTVDADVEVRVDGDIDVVTALAIADGLIHLARQLSQLGEHEAALSAAERALAWYVRLGHPEGRAESLRILGRTEHRLGLLDDALRHYRGSIDCDQEIGDRFWEAHALDELADVYAELGDSEVARSMWSEAATILAESHHPDADRIRSKSAAAGSS